MTTPGEHMRIGLRSPNVLAAQRLLDDGQVITAFEQLRGERTLQGVAGDRLGHAGSLPGRFHRTPQRGLIAMGGLAPTSLAAPFPP